MAEQKVIGEVTIGEKKLDRSTTFDLLSPKPEMSPGDLVARLGEGGSVIIGEAVSQGVSSEITIVYPPESNGEKTTINLGQGTTFFLRRQIRDTRTAYDMTSIPINDDPEDLL